MNSSGGIISGSNTPMNMYTYGSLNGVGPNDLPDVNFQEVADYFNLSSPLLSMSSLVGGQSTGSAKGKAKFTFDDFDVQSSTKNRTNKRRGVNPSVAAIINNPSSSLSRNNNKKHNRRGGVGKDDDNLLQPPKKRKKKGVISVNTELANNPNSNNSNTKHQGSNDNNNNKNNNSSYGNNNNKGSKMKELPPSARFAKEMWGRKR